MCCLSVTPNVGRRRQKRAAEQAVRKRRGSSELEPLFVGSSIESCSKIERTNEIDCAQNVVGQDAESGFGFDLGYASGKEPPPAPLIAISKFLL
jgi:hypothetical protein